MIFIGYDSEEDIEKDKVYYDYMENAKEIWRQVIYDNKVYPYEISNKGNMRQLKTKKPKRLSKGEYYKATILHPETKERHSVTVHRLMALAFLPIPQKYIDQGLTVKNLVPNHKDGKKYHNALYNLEWVTYSENTQHAFSTGLVNYKKGEDDRKATITNQQAIQIADLIQKGYTNKEISNMTNIGVEIIHSIKSRRSWRSFTKDYVFPRNVETVPFSISEEILRNICEDIMNGVNGAVLSKKYGVTKSYISNIRHQKIRPEITKQYDFEKRANIPKRQNDKLIHELCKDLQDGVKVSKLTKKYGVSMSFVSEVKHGKIRPDISKEYTF